MKRLLKAEATVLEKANGYKLNFGIKLNIKKLNIDCVNVQPSFETPSEILRENYIIAINKMKIADAIIFINEEIDNGYLSCNDLYLSN